MSKPSKLKAVEPKSAEPKKPKILIYGKPGAGKTWASLDFPGCYYIDTEGGANLDHYTDKLKASGGVYFGPEQGSLDFQTVIEQVQALATEKHPYKTIVIDSVSKLFNTAIASEAERLLSANLKNEYGADKKPAVSSIRRLVNWLSRIDMNVILICHEKDEYGLVNGKREPIGHTFDAHDKLEYELDLCLNIIKMGPNRISRIRKSRLQEFKEGDSFPWSYDAFANLYGKEVIEKETKQLELAKPEQLEEMRKLMSVVKLPEGQENKWLSAAQISGWEEMGSEEISRAIEHIKNTYLK